MKKDGPKVYSQYKKPTQAGEYVRLLCLTQELRGTSFILSAQRISLGKDPQQDIILNNSQVSKKHAEITFYYDKYILTDLNSQNGTYLNGQKVTQIPLQNNDKIVIGPYVFKFDKFLVETEEEKKEKKQEYIKNDLAIKKKKSLLPFIAIMGVGVFLFLASDEENRKILTQASSPKTLSDSFSQIQVRPSKGRSLASQSHRDLQSKLGEIFHRGLREYAQKNYFRSLREFQLALSLDPGNSRASFYVNKIQQELEEEIKTYNEIALKDEEALRYSRVFLSLCSIIRVLQGYPEDERYKKAIEKIERLRIQTGNKIPSLAQEKQSDTLSKKDFEDNENYCLQREQ